MFSTSTKIAFGYILLICLLFGAIGYIYRQMSLLTSPSETEATFSNRRKTTNQIVTQLYEAEIIGQTLRAGRLYEYTKYKRAMKQAGSFIDSLQIMLTDTLQQARLDTVRTLLLHKEQNMVLVLEAMRENPTDELYKQQLDSLIMEQDSILNSTHVRRKIITHHNTYTIHHKPKKFFRRLADVFSPGKPDSTQVNNVIQEEYTDTIDEAYNPVDTIATMLTNIQHRVFQSRQEQQRTLDARINQLRIAGGALSQRVNQLLESIETDEQEALEKRLNQEQEIREQAASTMATIAILAVLLVLIFFTIIWRDITRSNHYRRELEKAKLYAENLLVAREKLMLTITHDIKAPAGSILGYIDLLLRLVQDRRQEFYLHNMRSSAHHLLDLITSLLDYHRLEAGKMDLHPVVFNPHELFENIYTSFLPIAEKKLLTLNFDEQVSSRLSLEGDPFRIRQIAENLISNALKFTEKGGITLRTHYEQNQFSFSVSDTGCGMTPEEQAHIFQAFTRLRSAQGQEGFGLGLSITQKLVELLSGTIEIESTPGQGTTFSISMPLPRITKPREEEAPSSLTLQTEVQQRILLIDDDRIQLNLTEAMICSLFEQAKENIHPVIRCCEQPEELFKLVQSEPFDLILTDIQMPVMNGFDLLHTLRNLNTRQAQTIPVIAITARSDMDESDFRAQGFAGCLHKPFSQQELMHIFQCHITPKKESTPPLNSQSAEHPICNLSALTAFSADDAEAAHEIIQTFATETRKNAFLLQQAINEKDTSSLCTLAHKMLPTFTMIEAHEAIPSLQWLEAHRQDTQFTEEVHRHAETVIRVTYNVLNQIPGDYNDKPESV